MVSRALIAEGVVLAQLDFVLLGTVDRLLSLFVRRSPVVSLVRIVPFSVQATVIGFVVIRIISVASSILKRIILCLIGTVPSLIIERIVLRLFGTVSSLIIKRVLLVLLRSQLLLRHFLKILASLVVLLADHSSLIFAKQLSSRFSRSPTSTRAQIVPTPSIYAFVDASVHTDVVFVNK
mgnify:CR=1 FL=1